MPGQIIIFSMKLSNVSMKSIVLLRIPIGMATV